MNNKKLNSFFDKKFFISLLKSYFVIICVFVLALSVLIVLLSSKSINQKRESNEKSFFKTSSTNIENKLSLGKIICDNLITSKEMRAFKQALKNKSTFPIEEGTALHTKLSENKILESSIDMDVAIVVPSCEKVIHGGTQKIEYFLSQRNIDRKQCEEVFDRAKSLGTNRKVYFSYDNTLYGVCLAGNENEKSIFIVQIFDLKKMFSNVEQKKNNNFGIYHNGDLIASNGKNNKTDSFVSSKLSEVNPLGNDIYSFNDEDYYIYILPSSTIPGMYFSYSVPKENVTIDKLLSALWILLILLALIGVGFLISYRYAIRIYKPIGSVLNDIKSLDTESEYDESNDELDYLRSVIQGTFIKSIAFKENERLTNDLKKEKFLQEILDGMYLGEELSQTLDIFNCNYLLHGARVIVVKIDIKQGIGLTKIQIAELTAEILLNIKDKISTFSKADGVQIDTYRFAYVIAEADDVKANNIAGGIVEEFGGKFNLVVAVGNYCSDLLEVNTSYENALLLLEAYSLQPQKAIFNMSDLKINTESDYFYPIDLERNLVRNTIVSNKDEAMKILQYILKMNLFHDSEESKTEFKFAMVATLKRIFQQIEKKEADIFDEGSILYLELKSCKTDSELSAKLVDIFDKIITGVSGEYDNRISVTLDSIMSYINEHYTDDLSLQDIANEFNISVSYTGKIISNNIGEGFKSYINKLRIEKAKEILLSDEKIKMVDIPGMLGYNNSVTFLRVFKKYEGVSPTEFLRIHNKK